MRHWGRPVNVTGQQCRVFFQKGYQIGEKDDYSDSLRYSTDWAAQGLLFDSGGVE